MTFSDSGYTRIRRKGVPSRTPFRFLLTYINIPFPSMPSCPRSLHPMAFPKPLSRPYSFSISRQSHTPRSPAPQSAQTEADTIKTSLQIKLNLSSFHILLFPKPYSPITLTDMIPPIRRYRQAVPYRPPLWWRAYRSVRSRDARRALSPT